MKSKRIKGLLAGMLAAVLLISGCSQQTEPKEEATVQETSTGGSAEAVESEGSATGKENAEEQKDQSAAGTEDVQMGRYVENPLQLPENFKAEGSGAFAAVEMEDGSMLLLDEGLSRFVTKDNGSSWEQLPEDWKSIMPENAYVPSAKLGKDGSIAFVYTDDGTAEGENIGLMVDTDFYYHYVYVDKDGNARELDLRKAGIKLYISEISAITGEGKIISMTPNGIIYEIDPSDDTVEQLFIAMGGVGHGTLANDKYYLTTSSGLEIYDFAQGKVLERNSQLDANLVNYSSEIGGYYGAYVMGVAVQEDTAYFSCSKGIFSSDLQTDGSWQQEVDGSLTTFGSGNALMRDFIRLSDGSFLTIFCSGGISLFVYNADMAARPQDSVSVYTLYENDLINQAATLYMKENPDIYVEVEVGLGSGDLQSGKTAEDAIKNLNTKIMAGNGPDLLVMDELPMKSYQEKGILTNLAPVLSDVDVLPNIKTAFTGENGEIYMLPARIELPMIFGTRSAVSKVKDLESLAEVVEELRAGRQEDSVIANYAMLEDQMLQLLAPVSQSAWVTQDDKPDEAALTEFLTVAKRIYDAQMSGVSEETLKMYRENVYEVEPGQKNYLLDAASGCWPGMIKRPDSLSLGTVSAYAYGFCWFPTMQETDNSLEYALWEGQTANGFVPKVCLGISANAQHPQAAEELFRFLFGDSAQTKLETDGFPVKEKAIKDMIEKTNQKAAETPDEEGRPGLSWIGSSDNSTGESYDIVLRPASEEDAEKLEKLLYSVSEPCIAERTIREIVIREGEKVLSGEQSVEEGVKAIVKQVSLYLAE